MSYLIFMFSARVQEVIVPLFSPGAKNYPARSQETHHCLISGETLRGASDKTSSFVSDQGENFDTPVLVMTSHLTFFLLIFYAPLDPN